MKTKKECSVRNYLQGVPYYGQSSTDMSCGYYCALMLRVAVQGKKFYEEWCNNTAKGLPELCEALDNPVLIKDLHKKLIDIVEPKIVKRDVVNKLKEALKKGRPSILLLPSSLTFPDGHYVVVKGYIIEKSPKGEKHMFIVNDPLFGESYVSAEDGYHVKEKTEAIVSKRKVKG